MKPRFQFLQHRYNDVILNIGDYISIHTNHLLKAKGVKSKATPTGIPTANPIRMYEMLAWIRLRAST